VPVVPADPLPPLDPAVPLDPVPPPPELPRDAAPAKPVVISEAPRPPFPELPLGASGASTGSPLVRFSPATLAQLHIHDTTSANHECVLMNARGRDGRDGKNRRIGAQSMPRIAVRKRSGGTNSVKRARSTPSLPKRTTVGSPTTR
jgi:hypothetical protein